MKRTGYRYEVSIMLKISRAEVEHCINVAKSHYDLRCQQAGTTGFLEQMLSIMRHLNNNTRQFQMGIQEMDLLAKILEQEQATDTIQLHNTVSQILRETIDKSRVMNGLPKL